MRRRILVAMVVVTGLAVLAFGIPLGIVVQRFVNDDALRVVERSAVLASRDVSSDFATSGDPVELPEDANVELGLYGPDGALVAGRGPSSGDPVVAAAFSNDVVDDRIGGQLVVAVPVSSDEQVIGVVRAARQAQISDRRIARSWTLLAVLGMSVVAAAGGLGWVLAGRLSRPVGRLRDAARDLGDGDFGIDVAPSSIPEIDQAANALNATAARLGGLVARERSFSADASHQLRTPLAGMRAAVETELAFPRDDRAVVLNELLSDLDRLDETVEGLLALARTEAELESVDLDAVLAGVQVAWAAQLRRAGRRIEITETRFQPRALANASVLRHALDVLIDNCVRHGAGTVRVAVDADDDSVRVSVSDDGPGFDSHDLPMTEGAGMGLALAGRLVDAVGGRLVLPSGRPSARVEILLRRARAT